MEAMGQPDDTPEPIRRPWYRSPGLWLAGGAAVLFYLAVDPERFTPIPPCPLRETTGLLCFGCGGQRALHALLRGDLAASWALNPLVILAGPLLALGLVVREGHRLLRGADAPPLVPVRWTVLAVVAGLVVFMIARNLV